MRRFTGNIPALVAVSLAMTKFRITYTLPHHPRRELIIELASREATSRSVARAILKHEFAEVDAPFGPHESLTADQALARFAITDVNTSVVSD